MVYYCYLSSICPIGSRCLRQSEHHISIHFSITIVISVTVYFMSKNQRINMILSYLYTSFWMKSLVKAIKKAYKMQCKLSSLLQLMIVKLTLLMTAIWAIISIIVNQIPIFSALSATALLVSQTNFWASSLISTQLFRRAKSGARGKAATNIVINPNWRTEKNNNFMKILDWSFLTHF